MKSVCLLPANPQEEVRRKHIHESIVGVQVLDYCGYRNQQFKNFQHKGGLWKMCLPLECRRPCRHEMCKRVRVKQHSRIQQRQFRALEELGLPDQPLLWLQNGRSLLHTWKTGVVSNCQTLGCGGLEKHIIKTHNAVAGRNGDLTDMGEGHSSLMEGRSAAEQMHPLKREKELVKTKQAHQEPGSTDQAEGSTGRTLGLLVGSVLLFLSLRLGLAKPAFCQSLASPSSTVTSASSQQEEVQGQGRNEAGSSVIGEMKGEGEVPQSGEAEENLAPGVQEGADLQTDEGGEANAAPDAAEMVLIDFLERHPEDMKTLQGLLYLRLRKGEVRAALEVLDKLLALQPTHLPWQLMKAQALEFVGDLEQARHAFEGILEAHPLSARALQGLAIIMSKMGEDKQMLEMLQRAVNAAVEASLPIEATNLRMLLGQMHTLQGNLQEAMQQYRDVTKDNPTDFRPYLCQGLVYSILGETDEAERQFRKYRKLCPETFPNRTYLDELMLNAKTVSRKLQDRERHMSTSGKHAFKPLRQPSVGSAFPSPAGVSSDN